MDNRIILGDNLDILKTLPSKFASFIYVDPPFNTGKTQVRNGGSYDDSFDNFESFLIPRIELSLRCLQDNGSLFVHLDYREVHYVKVALDKMLGKNSFINEIIWAYDYGGRNKKRWSTKHDTILWYALNPDDYIFNYEVIDRIPYMAPALVGPEKALQGKTPTDVWWHTIVPTNGKEKTGYPTQKPIGILKRLVRVHSNSGDFILDYFGGSGTSGHAAGRLGRKFVLVDSNPEATKIMWKRLYSFSPNCEGFSTNL